MGSVDHSRALAVFAASGAIGAILSLVRMLERPTKTTPTGYAYIRRTSFMIGKLLRRKKLE
jgi:hypothetical protein